MKKCTKCGEQKELSEFYANKGNKNGIHSECKGCHLEYKRTHPVNNVETKGLYNKMNPHKAMVWRLKSRYGITPEDLKEMKMSQDSKCAICNKDVPLKVDHDHSTNVVRGLLCNGCNRGIGFFNENVSVLESAIRYLNKHKAQTGG